MTASSPKRVQVIIVGQLLGFSFLIMGLLLWGIHHGGHITAELAETTARESAVKDLLYRGLLVENGGVYMKVSETVQPDPALQHRNERDITTPAGQNLTFVSPNRIMRLAYNLAKG
jgi:hypothetical protein